MNRLIDLLQRSVGFGRTKPKTATGRTIRNANRLLTAVALVWFTFHLFPQVVFAHHVTAKGVSVYAREPLPPETTQRIAEAMSLVSNSELAIPGRTERIFICNQPWLLPFPRADQLPRFCVHDADNRYVFVADADIAGT